MVQISFAIKVNPRVFKIVEKGGEQFAQKASDTFLVKTSRMVKKEMQAQAPKRTGRLRAGIKIVKKEKTGGGLDRRANISVESTVPYSKYVVKGAPPSIGDGSPGTGKFFGPGGFGFRATRGFTGKKAFRSGSGFWPGFQPNDFVERAAQIVGRKIREEAKFIGISSYTESYNKLGIRFG